MVTGIFLIQLEMKQFLLQHQFLFNSELIKSLTFITELQQMSQKTQKAEGGKWANPSSQKNYITT